MKFRYFLKTPDFFEIRSFFINSIVKLNLFEGFSLNSHNKKNIMLSIKQIREEKEIIAERLEIRNFDALETLDSIIELDNKKRQTQTEKDKLQEKLNSISKDIGKLFAKGLHEKGNRLKKETLELKSNIKESELLLSELETKIHNLLVEIPNLPHESVPAGSTDADNVIIKEGTGTMPKTESPKAHWDLIKKYNIIDFELGTKITGAGFPVYIGQGAKLQRALISFFLDEAEKSGYKEVLTPVLVNSASAFGTGQLPDKDGQMYKIPQDNFYLIPTAEVPVTNIYRGVVLNEKELPVKNTAYSLCFRREAGSWGADVRGLNRLHQFDKVEIVRIEKPENSYNALDEMVKFVESLVKKLNLPYRIARLCGGDLGFASALTYDFEAFSAAQNKWLEISSVSNFESFQTNRLKLRYKCSMSGKNITAHSLNGSALALPRVMATILENYQSENGIEIPEVLRKYTGFSIITNL